MKRSTNRLLQGLLLLIILMLSISPMRGVPKASAATTALAFSAVADSRVEMTYPDTNYGGGTALYADTSPVEWSYLRFDVSNLSGTIQSATLRLYAFNGTTNGPAVYATSNSWTESGITWNNRPARIGSAIDDKDTVSSGMYTEYNVTPLLAGNGTYSFVLVPTSSDGVDMYSQQASGNRPQLVVTTSSSTEPAPTEPAPTEPAPAVNPLTCEGYPQQRHFVDAQSWWTTTPGKSGTDFGHVHVGACIPEREVLSSNQELDIRVVLHDNPGKVAYTSVVFKGTNQEEKVWQSPGGQTCPNPGTCTFWFKAPLDISRFVNSGLQEIRFRTFVDEPDGNRMIASHNSQVYINNGKSKSDVTRNAYLRGKGWYTDFEYCEAALKSVPLPDQPVSGIWNPYGHLVWHGTSADARVTAHSIRLDSDAHAGIPGTIVKEGSGEFSGNVSIDTTSLANGRHRLVMRADCDTSDGSTNSGVLLVFFNVQN